MSLSLSAVQADGYYQPPDFDHKKHGTLNKIHGTHRLGDRAARIHEGIIVVRFEMPFKTWCLGCNSLIAKGVRFNADKQSIGKFHSTNIYQFSMICHLCPQSMVIKTDPETASYVCVSGCRRKVETYTTDQIEGYKFRTQEELLEIERDPVLRLEIGKSDAVRAEQSSNDLTELLKLQEIHKEDAKWNGRLRSAFRESKRVVVEKKCTDEEKAVRKRRLKAELRKRAKERNSR